METPRRVLVKGQRMQLGMPSRQRNTGVTVLPSPPIE